MGYRPAPISGDPRPAQRPTPPSRPVLHAVGDPHGSPPAAVRQACDVAARIVEEFSSRQVNLHFEVDRDGGNVRIQVLNGEGFVIREIPARSLLDTLSGSSLIVDQLG